MESGKSHEIISDDELEHLHSQYERVLNKVDNTTPEKERRICPCIWISLIVFLFSLIPFIYFSTI